MKLIALSYILIMFMIIFANVLKSAKTQGKKYHHHGESLSIDYYAYQSGLKHWHPVLKSVLSISLLMMGIGFDSALVSMMILVTTMFFVVVIGKLSLVQYLRVLSIPITFILLSLLTISVDYSTLMPSGFSVRFFSGYLYTNLDLLKAAGLLGLKMFAAISCLQMLALTTPSSEVILVLKKCHLPSLIIELMALTYRFIFILLDVTMRMKNAAESRNGYVDYKASMRTFSQITAGLLIQSIKKANQYFIAMESRCYEGEYHYYEEERYFNPKLLATVSVLVSFIFMVGLNSYLRG